MGTEKISRFKLWQKIINLIICSSFIWWNLAYAAPQGGQVVAGGATISQTGNLTQINQSTAKAVINWSSFDTTAIEQVNFSQPSSSAIALNRITSGLPTMFAGLLTANGQVWILNPAGVLFTKTSRIDVSGLLVSTSDINNHDFMNGNYRFTKVPGFENGAVINDGEIVAHADSFAGNGLVALVAPGVENNGVIRANLGKVVLASGTAYTLDLYGDELIQFSTDSKVQQVAIAPDGRILKDAVSNNGKIVANGGQVLLTANTAGRIVDNVVSMNGVIEAKTATKGKNGVIILGGSEGSVSVTGTINVSAKKVGNAGKIIIKGDRTKITGKLIAKGGSESGDGGFVETSGNYLDVSQMQLDVSAVNGNNGTWLLDPYNIFVTNATTNNSGPPTFTPTGDDSTIDAAQINAQLTAGTNVILDTGFAGSQVGNITINAAISSAGTGSLTLNAENSVFINQPITLAADLTITATNGSVQFGAVTDVAGNLLVTAGSFISQSQAILVGGASDFTANSLGIGLGNTGNNFVGAVSLTAADVSTIANAIDLFLDTSSVPDLTINSAAGVHFVGPLTITTPGVEGLTINASGTVDQLPGADINSAAGISINSNSADIILNNPGNSFPNPSTGFDVILTNTGIANATINASGPIDISSSSIGNNFTINAPVELSTSTALTVGGVITFNDTLGASGAGNFLFINGNAVFNATVGTPTPFAGLEVTGTTLINTSSITTAGDQIYDGVVTLNQNVIMDASSSGDIIFNDDVNGLLFDLTITIANDVLGNGITTLNNFAQNNGTGQTNFLDLESTNVINNLTTTISGGTYNGDAVTLQANNEILGSVNANSLFLGGSNGSNLTNTTVSGMGGQGAANETQLLPGAQGDFFVNGFLVGAAPPAPAPTPVTPPPPNGGTSTETIPNSQGTIANTTANDPTASPDDCQGDGCAIIEDFSEISSDEPASGSVSCVIGFATAVDDDGNERILLPGDQVYADEKIVTDKNTQVRVQYKTGEKEVVGAGQEYVVKNSSENVSLG